MFNYNFITNNYRKEIVFFFILYFSLIIGFIFNENSSGGAYLDYINQKRISKDFSTNFLDTLLNYDKYTTRHSPVLIIFLSLFEKIKLNDFFIRQIYLHINLLLPFFFYLSLKIKFSKIDNIILMMLVGLIFTSPIFRSLSIWPDSRLLGLTLFSISIFYYLKYLNSKSYIYTLHNILFYSAASYVSPNFSVFSLFFMYSYLKDLKFFSIKFISLIILNLFLSSFAFFYIFYLKINFLNQAAIVTETPEYIFSLNYFNQLLIIPSIFLFYFIPFYLTKILQERFINLKLFFISFIILIFSMYFFDYKYEYTGGGIFFNISNFLFANNYLFYISSYIGILILLKISLICFENFLLIFLIFLSNPQMSIYHKYYDPFYLLLIFLLFSIKINLRKMKILKNTTFIYVYFILFLLLNFIKKYV